MAKGKKKNALLATEDTADEQEKTTSAEVAEQDDQADAGVDASSEGKEPALKVKPVERKENTDEALKSDIVRTKEILEKDKKVMFMVPLAEGEKKGSVHECWINGYKFVVKKGIMQELPITIANMLAEHYQITSEAGNSFRLDLNSEKADALG